MSLLGVVLLVATVGALLYVFLIRASRQAVSALLATAGGFTLSVAPDLLGRYGRLPPPLIILAVAVGVPAVLGLAMLFRDKPLVLVWALVVTMPLRVPIPIGSQSVFLLAPLYLVVLSGLLSVMGPSDGEPLWRADRMRMPLGALATAAGLSLMYSSGGVGGVVIYLCFWVAFSLMYHVLTVRLSDDQGRKHAVWALLTSGVVLAAVGIAQRVTGSVIYNVKVSEGFFQDTSLRVNSLFWDPNMFGRFLVIVLIFCAVQFAARRSRATVVLAAVAGILSLPALLLTYSRSSWTALSFAAVLLVWRFLGAWKAVAVAMVVLLAVTASFALIDAPQFNLPNSDHVRWYGEKFFGGRPALIQGGLGMFAANPAFGVGLGAFPTVFGRYRPLDYRGKVVESHNSVVTVAAEMGAIGLALLVWFLVQCAKTAAGAAGASSADRAMGAAAMTAIASLMVHSMFYGAFFEDPFAWFMLALAAVLVH